MKPIVEQRIRVSANRVRICDFVPFRADLPRERVTQTPPLLCVEALSPEGRLSRAKLALADYLTMGVKQVGLMDPTQHADYTFDTNGLYEHEGLLTFPELNVSIDPEVMFADMD